MNNYLKHIMIIENHGIKTDKFYLPPFVLNEGEIIVLRLSNGIHLSETEKTLKDILSGKRKNKHIEIFTSLNLVEDIIESSFERLIYPLTVERYLKKKADLKNQFSKKIYDIDWITNDTKINKLPGNPRKQLSIYATLSKTRYLIFDLFGQDTKGRNETFNIVRESIKGGGGAILLDCFDGLESKCNKYIELEYLEI